MEPLKNMFSQEFIKEISRKIEGIDSAFSAKKFLDFIYQEDWEELKLMERAYRLADALYEQWQDESYATVGEKLIRIQGEASGLIYVFLPHYVSKYGLTDVEQSLQLLEQLTSGSTGEFAIRYFLQIDTQLTLHKMKEWSISNNEHIRRLASEGTRTRLPWAIKVKELDEHISEIIAILETLRHDDSIYVRKSVANNVNDLSKDYPDIILPLMKKWKSEGDAKLDWIVTRGLRTLLKKGNVEAQEILGYDNSVIIIEANLVVNKERVKLDEISDFSYKIKVNANDISKVRLQYEITYVKKHGTSAKRFFLQEKTVDPGTIIQGIKQHQWKELTTRKHYAGIHAIGLIVNGEKVAETTVELLID